MRGEYVLLCLCVLATAADVESQAGSVVEHQVASSALRNLQGEPEERSVLIYLPPSYGTRPDRRYPVVYLLHAFGATHRDWLGTANGYEGLDLAKSLDSLVQAGEITDFIVVMPDARTRLGGSWYVSSPTSGDWETFIARDLVAYVDRSFRTLKDRTQRSIVGQSMGGYGALRIAMRRPDVFGIAVAISPVPVTNPNPLGDVGMRIALDADRGNLAAAPVPARVLWSRAAAFSPAPDEPPAFGRLPYRKDGDALVVDTTVWDLWRQASLSGLVAAHADALRKIQVRIEVGDQDPVRNELSDLSGTLKTLGVTHEFEVFPGGHVRGVRDRFEQSVFQYLTAHLAKRRPSPQQDAL